MPVSKHVSWILAAALMVLAGNADALDQGSGPQRAAVDTDADGVGDNVDNCLLRPNADQRDTDADGIGNACDADLDNNCVINFSDLGLMKSVFFTADADADLDGNGVVNFTDLGIMKAAFFETPGPGGLPNLCTCSPPAVVPQVDPNFEFNGQEMFLASSLSQNGVAVPGVNNFADQDNGLYLARIFARSAGTFDYRITDQASSIEYCSDTDLIAYAPLDLPFFGCAAPPGSLQISAPGCYEFAMRTDETELPPTVELTLVERLGRWDIQVDAAGGVFTAPNGVELDIPAGAVGGPVSLTIGDIPCEQIDALFASTTLNTHDNRCIGAFSGEPDGFAFNAPVGVRMPATALLPDEIPLWLASTPGEQDYTLIPTVLTYRGDLAIVEATLDQFSIIASAGATSREPARQRFDGLPPCCSQTPTPINCCCTTFNVTSAAGDTAGTDCDCQLVGFELEIEFPNCPGSPTFNDSEQHSTENCPTDLVAGITPAVPLLWTCEGRDIQMDLTGTNESGTTCSLPLPVNWSLGVPGIASIVETGPNMARVTGDVGGSTTVIGTSLVGAGFSFSAPLDVVDLAGTWSVTEDGEQTCESGGEMFTEDDFIQRDVQVNVPNCDTIEVVVGAPGLDGSVGSLMATGNPALPFTYQIQAVNASNTLGCFIFNETNAGESDFGEPICPQDATCQALSCSETVTDNGTISSPDVPSGVGDSSWSFNASWSETIDGMTTNRSGSCTGTSDLSFIKQ